MRTSSFHQDMGDIHEALGNSTAMLWLTIRKEFVHNILSFRFILMYVLLFCLVLLSLFLMASDYGVRRHEYAAEIGKQGEQIDELEDIQDYQERFRRFSGWIRPGLREPRNLSILARGLEGDLPSRAFAERRVAYRSSEEKLGKNMFLEIFQTPDYVYVINVVMSLLALLIVFDSVCGEKERGTLKLLLANAVARDTVLVAKWIGGLVSVVAPFSVAVLGGYVYLYLGLGGIGDPGGDGTSRFLLIFVVSLVYISAFLALGLLISVLTHRSSTALLVALMVWIGWILVVPNVAPIVARLIAPVPSYQVLEREKRAIEEDRWRQLRGLSGANGLAVREQRQRIQREADKRRDALEESHRDRMRAQVNLSQKLARLSPSASFLFAATRLAGTGPELAASFHEALERYREDERKYREGLPMEKNRHTGLLEIKNEDWFKPDELPRFRLLEESLGASVEAALLDVLLLVLFNVVFVMLSFICFLRYDIS